MYGLTVFISLLLGVLSADKLKLSILMFRHGDRSAITMIPNDIYDISSWPQGPGKLTTIGMENHLKNGKFFKKRYTDPNKATYLEIDEHYKTYQVYTRSTDRDRTLMSAESMLASLFPPPENKLDSPLDVWQPIPVHTVAMNTEPMLDGSPASCKYWANNVPVTVKKNPNFISFMENSTSTTTKILTLTGTKYESDEYLLLKSIADVHDTLFCEKSHNMTFKKEWIESDLFGLVTPYAEMAWKTYGMMTDKEKSLAGGVLLHELKSRVKAAVNGTDKIKLILFSGHDTTLASILTCLGVYDYVQIPYATVLMLELWETETGHVVRFHRHHKDETFITYKLPGCTDNGCTLQQFYSVNTHLEMTATEYKDQCLDKFPDVIPSISKNALLLALCVTILLCLSSLSIITFYTYKLKQSNTHHGPKYKIIN